MHVPGSKTGPSLLTTIAPTGQFCSHVLQRVHSCGLSSTGLAVAQPRNLLPSHFGIIAVMSRAGSSKLSGASSRQSAPTVLTSSTDAGPSPRDAAALLV